MARTMVRITAYGQNATAVVTGAPLTMACWIKPTTTAIAVNCKIMDISDASATDQQIQLRLEGGTGGDPIAARAVSGSSGDAVTTTGVTVNTWHHIAGVFTSATSRDAYIDGGSKGSNTTSKTPTGLDTTTVGFEGNTGAVDAFDGPMSDAAIWSVALTADEILQLSKGVSPRFIQPSNLVAYWPLDGSESPEPDIVGGADLTLTGAPAASADPSYSGDVPGASGSGGAVLGGGIVR